MQVLAHRTFVYSVDYFLNFCTLTHTATHTFTHITHTHTHTHNIEMDKKLFIKSLTLIKTF